MKFSACLLMLHGIGNAGGRHGGGFNRFGGQDSKPVKEGHVYLMDIKSEGKQGDGVALYKGLVVFVPGTQVGDRVYVKILQVRRTTAIGEISRTNAEASDD